MKRVPSAGAVLGSGDDRLSSEAMTTWGQMVSRSRRSSSSSGSSNTTVLIFLALLVGVLVSARWINNATILSTSDATIATTTKNLISTPITRNQEPPPKIQLPKPKPKPPPIIPFSCPSRNLTPAHICSSFASFPSPLPADSVLPSSTCPDYFRWIHEDLRPWKSTGITHEMVERANVTANFRLVIINGRAYVEKYRHAFQTRDVFTLWGILQLLRRYPGQIPDLDLMFDCVDWPVIKASDYGTNTSAPPPLFRYCADDSTLDIVFPDWSFWGWSEINIKPWEALQKELNKANERLKWVDRKPYAYWKGNPSVAATRQDLLKCNVSKTHDWNARVYAQDWLKETKRGFRGSDLASQCTHRYKIYIEGSAWSVSEKYILACDSPTLLVKPKYYDFFTRGLMPVQHYWPIRDDDKCRSIKYAVDWGNSHKNKAQAMGKAASEFIQEKLKMDYIYDYMFHLLNEYAKLLRYKPSIPPKAVEMCSESMACYAEGLEKKFMMDSMVRSPHTSTPCTLLPPFQAVELKMFRRRKDNNIKQVETWEQRAWENQKSKL